jgi:hypothetical protein
MCFCQAEQNYMKNHSAELINISAGSDLSIQVQCQTDPEQTGSPNLYFVNSTDWLNKFEESLNGTVTVSLTLPMLASQHVSGTMSILMDYCKSLNNTLAPDIHIVAILLFYIALAELYLKLGILVSYAIVYDTVYKIEEKNLYCNHKSAMLEQLLINFLYSTSGCRSGACRSGATQLHSFPSALTTNVDGHGPDDNIACSRKVHKSAILQQLPITFLYLTSECRSDAIPYTVGTILPGEAHRMCWTIISTSYCMMSIYCAVVLLPKKTITLQLSAFLKTLLPE